MSSSRYLADKYTRSHRPDCRMCRLIEFAGESLEPADCLHRRCGNPLHPAPHGPIGYAKQGSGIHLREPSPGEAGLRFRPVMMTSVAFILGLFPLVTPRAPAQ